ncbi:MAG: putative lipopolysaccharide heptosyltransferase III [Burkholderiales bacterium]
MGPSDAIDFSSVKRALVVKLRHHGDVLLTTPVLSVLKSHMPQGEIDALVYGDTRAMLDGHPSLTNVFAIDRAWKKLSFLDRATKEWHLLAALRRRNYDLLIHLTEHPRGAWLARFLHCAYAVAPDYPRRSKFWRASFTHRFSLPKNPYRHMVEWNLDALRRIGVQPLPEERKPILVAGSEGEAEATQLLKLHGINERSFIHIHPASRWSFKCWPERRNAALIDALASRGERVVLTAAPVADELDFVARIVSHCKSTPINLSGLLSLKGLAALTARAKLFIGVDSAPMHMAAAMGTPVVALFGPSGEKEWGPWSPVARVVASNTHTCRPCGIDGCGGGKISDCLVTLEEDRVLAAALELLRVPLQPH